MLRIDPRTKAIPVDYQDDYLELLALLVDATGLEHSLMLAYLYALFSIKDRYRNVRGDVRTRSFLEHSPAGRFGTEVLLRPETFLDVAIEEMQHLSFVNQLLVDLGGAPCLMPHLFPYSSDLYPFPIELASLDRFVAATYLWMEADTCALSLRPACEPTREPVPFILEVRKVLREGGKSHHVVPIDDEKPDHVGSIYRMIIDYLGRLSRNPPPHLPADFPWAAWQSKMTWVRDQGEITHYKFFRDLFSGAAFGGDASIWQPGPDFPAIDLPVQTAYTGRPTTIPDDAARRLAWLSNLHYWILLALLDTSYRMGSRKLKYEAIDQMTLALWSLGLDLAQKYQVGVPFDPMGPRYTLGRDDRASVEILKRLVLEGDRHARALGAEGLLPEGYDIDVFALTLAGLQRPG